MDISAWKRRIAAGVAAIRTTAKAGTNIRYGVNFEANLPVYMRALGIIE